MTGTNRQPSVCTGLDVCKFLCCLLIAASHLPSLLPSPLATAYFKGWYFRFCVPFFFACSGFFFSRSRHKGKSILRLALLTGLAYLLYLPRILEGAQGAAEILSRLRWNLVIGYEHLWYLSASLEAMLLWFLAEKIPGIRVIFRKAGPALSVLLLLLGALLGEYYPLVDIPILQAAGDRLADFGGPRNVIFMGLPLMLLGGWISQNQAALGKLPSWTLILAWVALRLLAFGECSFLFAHKGLEIRSDLSFFGIWPGLILLLLGLRWQLPICESLSRLLRKMSEYVYILHPLAGSLLGAYLSPLPLYLSAVGSICLLCYLLQKVVNIKKSHP